MVHAEPVEFVLMCVLGVVFAFFAPLVNKWVGKESHVCPMCSTAAGVPRSERGENFADKCSHCGKIYLTHSVSKFVLQKSIPIQIRQLILYVSNNTG